MIVIDNQIEKILLEINVNFDKFKTNFDEFHKNLVAMRLDSNINSFLQRYEQEKIRIANQEKYEFEQKEYDKLNWELKNTLNSFDGRLENLSDLLHTSFHLQELIKEDEDEADLISFIKNKPWLFLKNTKKKSFPFGASFYSKSKLAQKISSSFNFVSKKVTKDFRFYYFSFGI